MVAIEELQQDGYPPEHEAFQATLTGILQLTQQQANRLIGEDIDMATSLGPLDDNTILSCFTPATRYQRVNNHGYMHLGIGSMSIRW
jgi:hypothetical protein